MSFRNKTLTKYQDWLWIFINKKQIKFNNLKKLTQIMRYVIDTSNCLCHNSKLNLPLALSKKLKCGWWHGWVSNTNKNTCVAHFLENISLRSSSPTHRTSSIYEKELSLGVTLMMMTVRFSHRAKLLSPAIISQRTLSTSSKLTVSGWLVVVEIA